MGEEQDPEPKRFGDLVNEDGVDLDGEKDVGFFDDGVMKHAMTIKDIATQWQQDKRFAPRMKPAARRQLFNGWNKALTRAKDWED